MASKIKAAVAASVLFCSVIPASFPWLLTRARAPARYLFGRLFGYLLWLLTRARVPARISPKIPRLRLFESGTNRPFLHGVDFKSSCCRCCKRVDAAFNGSAAFVDIRLHGAYHGITCAAQFQNAGIESHDAHLRGLIGCDAAVLSDMAKDFAAL